MQAGNKTWHKQLLLIVIVLSLMTLRYVNGDELENQQKALNIISDFADRICTRVPLEGEKGELSGQAKADLSSILRQLVGLEVIAKAKSEHYKGILQHELPKATTESNDCRLAVLRELKSIITYPSQGPSYTLPPPPAVAQPDCEALRKRTTCLGFGGPECAEIVQQLKKCQ